jgi:hypothetical protein
MDHDLLTAEPFLYQAKQFALRAVVAGCDGPGHSSGAHADETCPGLASPHRNIRTEENRRTPRSRQPRRSPAALGQGPRALRGGAQAFRPRPRALPSRGSVGSGRSTPGSHPWRAPAVWSGMDGSQRCPRRPGRRLNFGWPVRPLLGRLDRQLPYPFRTAARDDAGTASSQRETRQSHTPNTHSQIHPIGLIIGVVTATPYKTRNVWTKNPSTICEV